MIYDTKTKNISFLQIAKTLRENGVKCMPFMLRLNDESLQGVDPFSEHLDPITKAKIYKECRNNFWYYVREVVRIPQTGASVMFQLSLASCAQFYLELLNFNDITVLPRQTGKTTAEATFLDWALQYASENCNLTLMNKSYSQSQYNMRMMKDIMEISPQWLMSLIRGPADTYNSDAILFKSNNNWVKLCPAATSKDKADEISRGISTALVWSDETAFMHWNEIIFPAFIPAWSKASEDAKKHGVPYGIHLTTTPNDLDTAAGKFANKILVDACRFSFKMYDMTPEELLVYVHKNSGNDYVSVQYDYRALGKTDAWYEDMCRKMLGNTLKIKRELLLEWPLSNEYSVFTEDQLGKVKHYVKPPMFWLPVNDYDFAFYERPDFGLNYIIGEDIGGGLGQDRTVMIFLHPADFHVVGLFRSSNISLGDFVDLNKEILTMYFPNAVIIPENNSYGLAVIDGLRKDPECEQRMYRELAERKGEITMNDGRVVKKTTARYVYGVSTTRESRKCMMQILPSIVDGEYDKLVSDELYGEIKTLQFSHSGKTEIDKIQAMPGAHDDIVMAYLIARYGILYGDCMQKMFHINKIPTILAAYDQAATEKSMDNFGNMIGDFNSMGAGEKKDPLLDSLLQSPEAKSQTASDSQYGDVSFLFGDK